MLISYMLHLYKKHALTRCTWYFKKGRRMDQIKFFCGSNYLRCPLFSEFDLFHLIFLASVKIKLISSCFKFSERTNFQDFKILITTSLIFIDDENERSENEEYDNFEIGNSIQVKIFLKNFLCKICVMMISLGILNENFFISFFLR